MSYHLLTVHPSDVLFFRDGRPMEGASTGHGAAWPLPHVLDSALHHALRRAEFEDFTPHAHTAKRSGKELNHDRIQHGRHFGSLKNAGPFPVHEQHGWFFPRPADASIPGSSRVTHAPLERGPLGAASSMPDSFKAVVSAFPPSKEKLEAWMSGEAWRSYLHAPQHALHFTPKENAAERSRHFLHDGEIFSAEQTVGIGIDPATGTQDGEQIYSASYLRLRQEFALGLIPTCIDKGDQKNGKVDLMAWTFPEGQPNRILAGGQQRVCHVSRERSAKLPLPIGMSSGFHSHHGKALVKWILLSPAIFPRLREDASRDIPDHPGGWLPPWVHPSEWKVLLKDPAAPRPSHQPGESRADYRRRIHREVSSTIDARLVAAMVPKPIPITGWALRDTCDETGILLDMGGARATHLAVPPGSVYYFECEDESAATALANALNWHGAGEPDAIRNRRSTLLGEKGFGIGVCGTWTYHAPHATS